MDSNQNTSGNSQDTLLSRNFSRKSTKNAKSSDPHFWKTLREILRP